MSICVSPKHGLYFMFASVCIFVQEWMQTQYSRSQWLQSHGRFNLGKSTIRCSENDDVSSRSSPMVSLSKSIQQVTNREAVGVLQGQRLANSQYDDNSKVAFSFPEEPDSPWQLRPKMFAYFFVQIRSSLLFRQRIYTANKRCGLAPCTTLFAFR